MSTDDLRDRIHAVVVNWSSSSVREVEEITNAVLAEVTSELQHLHSWDGLLSLLDEHWPEDIFPTEPDSETRDPGPRIVSLLRWVERLRAELAKARSDREKLYESKVATFAALRRETERAEQAEAERDALRSALNWETSCLGCADRLTALAELAALKAAVEQVQADAIEQQKNTGLTRDRWQLGVYAQASRTRRILRDALDIPEASDEH